MEAKCSASSTCLDFQMKSEEELTRSVPSLLEEMNRCSQEINEAEGQIAESNERQKHLQLLLKRVWSSLRARHGSQVVESSKPYFKAARALEAADPQVQNAVRAFSAAVSDNFAAMSSLRSTEAAFECLARRKEPLSEAQQERLARAANRVAQSQEERDRKEHEYTAALAEFRRLRCIVASESASLSDDALKALRPGFRKLYGRKDELAAEVARGAAAERRHKEAKLAYASTLASLEAVSLSVHRARSQSCDDLPIDPKTIATTVRDVFGDPSPAGSRQPCQGFAISDGSEHVETSSSMLSFWATAWPFV